MKENEHVFFNRAESIAEQKVCCDICFESVVFLLRDKDHEFTMGLSEILKYLQFSEKEGEVPPLPGEWWLDISSRYEIEVE